MQCSVSKTTFPFSQSRNEVPPLIYHDQLREMSVVASEQRTGLKKNSVYDMYDMYYMLVLI